MMGTWEYHGKLTYHIVILAQVLKMRCEKQEEVSEGLTATWFNEAGS